MARDAWLGWSKALWKRFGAVALGVVGIPLALNWLIDLSLTTGFTGMTALLLLAYTIETHKMRRQMVIQNEIAIQPLVIATIEYRPVEREGLTHAGAKQVVLRNIGRGPALFVQPGEIEVVPDADGRFVVKFEKTDCTEPGDEAAAGAGHYAEEEGKRDVRISAFIPSLDPRFATKSYDIPISYEDINGQRRESVVRMGKGGIRLLNHRKV